MTTADATVARPAATALPRKKIRWGEQLVHLVLFIAAAISVLTTVGIAARISRIGFRNDVARGLAYSLR